MKYSFDPSRRLIVVGAELVGPAGTAVLQLALDTGATRTLIDSTLLLGIGYDPVVAKERVRVTAGSGVEFAPLLSISQLTALGLSCANLSVLALTLPGSAGVDGLLGLDFLQNTILMIDFKLGAIELHP